MAPGNPNQKSKGRASRKSAAASRPAATPPAQPKPKPTPKASSAAVVKVPPRLISPGGGLPETLVGFGSSNVSSVKEIVYRITDYFDMDEAKYYQYLVDPYQTFLTVPALPAESASLSRILSVDAYALPAFNVETYASSSLLLTSCPVRAGGVAASGAQMSTLLVPTTVSKWVKVGHWNANDLFATANVTPAATLANMLPILSLALLNPDTFDLADQVKVQVKIVVHWAAQLPLGFTLSGAVATGDDACWSAGISTTPAPAKTSLPVQIEALKLRNRD